jgi:hypothetical protein
MNERTCATCEFVREGSVICHHCYGHCNWRATKESLQKQLEESAELIEKQKTIIKDMSDYNTRAAYKYLEQKERAERAEVSCDKADAELAALKAVTMGVGDGSGNLFVHGTYESIKACQALIFRMEKAESALAVKTKEISDLRMQLEVATSFAKVQRETVEHCQREALGLYDYATSCRDDTIAAESNLEWANCEIEGLQDRLAFAHEERKRAWKNRNRFADTVAEIALALGWKQRDAYAPDAVLRAVKIKLDELAFLKDRLDKAPVMQMRYWDEYCGDGRPYTIFFATRLPGNPFGLKKGQTVDVCVVAKEE